MALPVRLFAELALKSSTRCPRRTRAGRDVKCLDAIASYDPDCFLGARDPTNLSLIFIARWNMD
jgi:hypothetical protein